MPFYEKRSTYFSVIIGVVICRVQSIVNVKHVYFTFENRTHNMSRPTIDRMRIKMLYNDRGFQDQNVKESHILI